MRLETAQIRDRPRRFEGEEPASILELDNDPEVRPAGPVRYRLTAQRFADELVVRGSLEAAVGARCSRCGEPFVRAVCDPAFARAYRLRAASELIDLTPDLREAILLAFPTLFVCSEACRGLCARCGANLNSQACACGAPPPASPWAGLDQWKAGRPPDGRRRQ